MICDTPAFNISTSQVKLPISETILDNNKGTNTTSIQIAKLCSSNLSASANSINTKAPFLSESTTSLPSTTTTITSAGFDKRVDLIAETSKTRPLLSLCERKTDNHSDASNENLSGSLSSSDLNLSKKRLHPNIRHYPAIHRNHRIRTTSSNMVVTNPPNALTTIEHSYSSSQLAMKANRSDEEIANKTSGHYATDNLVSESHTNTTGNTNDDLTTESLESVSFVVYFIK
jgi:hypothetical protein